MDKSFLPQLLEQVPNYLSEPSKAYTQLADKLGIDCYKITTSSEFRGSLLAATGFLERAAELRALLINGGMEIYDYDKVENYLYKLAKEQNKRLYWKPLRRADVRCDLWWQNYVGPTNELYSRPVPESILEKVLYIEEHYKSKSLATLNRVDGQIEVGPFYFVSDYEVSNPDPFILAVTDPLISQGFGGQNLPYYRNPVKPLIKEHPDWNHNKHREYPVLRQGMFVFGYWDEPGFTG